MTPNTQQQKQNYIFFYLKRIYVGKFQYRPLKAKVATLNI